MNKRFWVKKIVGFIVCALLFAALLSWVVMLLWNNVLTNIINLPLISFWQAAGVLILSKILFGGFGGKRWGGGYKGYWNKDMREKWQHMSPEEREKLKQEWRERCGTWGKRKEE